MVILQGGKENVKTNKNRYLLLIYEIATTVAAKPSKTARKGSGKHVEKDDAAVPSPEAEANDDQRQAAEGDGEKAFFRQRAVIVHVAVVLCWLRRGHHRASAAVGKAPALSRVFLSEIRLPLSGNTR